MPMHTRRVWTVRVVNDPATLAKRLTSGHESLTAGFLCGRALLLNDSTGIEHIQEYAFVDADTLRQVESVTVSWSTPERLAKLIERAADGETDPLDSYGSVDAEQIEWAPAPKLSDELRAAADGWRTMAAESDAAGDHESAARELRLAEHMERLAHNHRARAIAGDDQAADPEQGQS